MSATNRDVARRAVLVFNLRMAERALRDHDAEHERPECCTCGHTTHEHVTRRNRRECTVCTCNVEDVRL